MKLDAVVVTGFAQTKKVVPIIDSLIGLAVDPRLLQQITSDMLTHELIERHITIERSNQIIAIPPRPTIS